MMLHIRDDGWNTLPCASPRFPSRRRRHRRRSPSAVLFTLCIHHGFRDASVAWCGVVRAVWREERGGVIILEKRLLHLPSVQRRGEARRSSDRAGKRERERGRREGGEEADRIPAKTSSSFSDTQSTRCTRLSVPTPPLGPKMSSKSRRGIGVRDFILWEVFRCVALTIRVKSGRAIGCVARQIIMLTVTWKRRGRKAQISAGDVSMFC